MIYKTATLLSLAVVIAYILLAVQRPTAVAPEVLTRPVPYYIQQCTQSLEVECASDIALTVKNCAAAFETEGADIIADIKCAKDLLQDKKNCWPCICAEAKKRGWKIIGC